MALGGIPREKMHHVIERSLAQYGKRAELLFRPGTAIWRTNGEQAMLLTHRWVRYISYGFRDNTHNNCFRFA
jgi:hypothetical protein